MSYSLMYLQYGYIYISIIILYHHKLLRESTCCSRTSCSRPRPSIWCPCAGLAVEPAGVGSTTSGGPRSALLGTPWLHGPQRRRSCPWKTPASGSLWWVLRLLVTLCSTCLLAGLLVRAHLVLLWVPLKWSVLILLLYIHTYTCVYVETTELGWSHHICRHWCPDSKPRLKQYKSWDFNPVWWLSWLNHPPVSDLDKRPWDLLTHLLGPYEFQDA